ncbi:MAG: hypothetical protein R3F17_10985 [Planctomycetota bacterium]
MGIFHQLACSTLPLIPRPVMRRLAGRYIAGEELGQAISRLEELQQPGSQACSTCSVKTCGTSATRARPWLNTSAAALAEKSIDAYVSGRNRTYRPAPEGAIWRSSCTTNCSPTARSTVRSRAWRWKITATTDATLASRTAAGETPERWHRAAIAPVPHPHDIDNLPQGPVDVRTVKGIYRARIDRAHRSGSDPRGVHRAVPAALESRSFHRARQPRRHPRAAPDGMGRANGVARDRYEIEVLLGVREPIWQVRLAEGHKVRVYVPYGPDWRAYSQRRLRKNPQMLKAVMLGMFRK